jgi:hypothetical protein
MQQHFDVEMRLNVNGPNGTLPIFISPKPDGRLVRHGSAPILSAKLVESRTPKQRTVLADSLPARETHRFSRNRTRPDDFRQTGLQPARFNQRISELFLVHNSPPALER